jgi:hypothetical protein
MSKTPYRVIFYEDEHGYGGWEFDETEYETAEAAYDDALKNHQYNPFRVVKLCYPKED